MRLGIWALSAALLAATVFAQSPGAGSGKSGGPPSGGASKGGQPPTDAPQRPAGTFGKGKGTVTPPTSTSGVPGKGGGKQGK